MPPIPLYRPQNFPGGPPLSMGGGPSVTPAGGSTSAASRDPYAGLLPPEVIQGARGDALIGLGSALLEASGPQPLPMSLGQALGRGVDRMRSARSGYLDKAMRATVAKSQMRNQQLQSAIAADKYGRDKAKAQRLEAAISSLPPDQQAIARLNPEAYAEQMTENRFGMKYKEREVPMEGDTVQKQVSTDGGRTWQDFGEPYNRRDPYLVTSQYNPASQQVETFAVPRSSIPPGGGPLGSKAPVQPSDAEFKAAGFAARIADANATLQQYEGVGADWKSLFFSQDDPRIANLLKSEERQKFEQATRNFVNAVLRRESGAVISEQEFDNAAKQYFPQPGDGPETIAQKRRNRELVYQNMVQSSGRARQQGQPSQWEGMTAVNPTTGERIIYRNGTWEPLNE